MLIAFEIAQFYGDAEIVSVDPNPVDLFDYPDDFLDEDESEPLKVPGLRCKLRKLCINETSFVPIVHL